MILYYSIMVDSYYVHMFDMRICCRITSGTSHNIFPSPGRILQHGRVVVTARGSRFPIGQQKTPGEGRWKRRVLTWENTNSHKTQMIHVYWWYMIVDHGLLWFVMICHTFPHQNLKPPKGPSRFIIIFHHESQKKRPLPWVLVCSSLFRTTPFISPLPVESQ